METGREGDSITTYNNRHIKRERLFIERRSRKGWIRGIFANIGKRRGAWMRGLLVVSGAEGISRCPLSRGPSCP